jgi:hypothetical protein
MNEVIGTQISYEPASFLGFILNSRRQSTPWSFIGVMILLHFLPRFERVTQTSDSETSAILGREVETLDVFVARHRARFNELK